MKDDHSGVENPPLTLGLHAIIEPRIGNSLGSLQRNPVGGVVKRFGGEAYWMLFESNSRPPGNLLSDSLLGALSLSVISGSGKIEPTEGEGETREHCPQHICLSIHCLYPIIGDGGVGGKWNGMRVTDPSLAWMSGGELR